MTTKVGFRNARGAWIVATVAIALVVVPVAVWFVVSGVRAVNGDFQITMEAGSQVEPPLPAGWEVAGALPVSVTTPDPPFTQFLLLVGSKAAGFLLTVGVLWLIQRVAASMRRGDPFQQANVRRLRGIGLLFLIGYPLAVFVDGFFKNWFFSNEQSPALAPDMLIDFPVFSLGAVLGGVCMLVLGEVFRYGVGLREDVEATV